VLLAVRPRIPLTRSTGTTVRADVRDGMAYLRHTPRVRDLVITLSGLNVFVGPVLSVGLALHAVASGWGAVGLGWLTASIGVGAALGTLVALRWRPRFPLRAAVLLLFAQASALAVVGVGDFTATLVGTTVVGVVAGLASPMLSGAFQATVDEEYVGRVSSVLTLADDALAPLSMAGFGLLAGVIGLGAASSLFAACFIALLLFAISRPHVRDLRIDGSLPSEERNSR
ncbi:MAG TPA: hypothetical protein VNO31_26210, partial [Umezawaea sp.]|nr:hypothetical protein [Umezawaea sp.]